MNRRAELAAGLAGVGERVTSACRAAGRERAEVTLVVVTKTFPAADVRLLADLGVRHVGENRDDEAAAKAAACADLALSWHFVGQLQTNKVRSVLGYAAVIHSVDRARLARALSRAASAAGRTVDVLVQVSLDPEGEAAGRGGVPAAGLPALADLVTERPGVRLAGLMAVAPARQDAAAAFARIAELAVALRTDHPEATMLSAGMSSDLEQAIACGATHVRVGSAILGRRPVAG